MSHDEYQAMPSRAELEQADAHGFVLQIAPEQGIRVSLAGTFDEVAMNGRFECYSLLLALPEGVSLPSEVYRLFGPEGQQWLLLMTPVLPGADGRHLLEAVIHREIAG